MTIVIKCNHDPCAVYANPGILARDRQDYETVIKTPLTVRSDSPVDSKKWAARQHFGAHGFRALNNGSEYGACECQMLSVMRMRASRRCLALHALVSSLDCPPILSGC